MTNTINDKAIRLLPPNLKSNDYLESLPPFKTPVVINYSLINGTHIIPYYSTGYCYLSDDNKLVWVDIIKQIELSNINHLRWLYIKDCFVFDNSISL